MYTNINGFWRKANGVFINISGYWRKVNSAFVNISGVWRSFFASEMSTSSPATISLSINNSTYLATLTGRTYSWVPGPPTLNYVFQWSDDGGTFWTTISSASAINPAYGSYNEYTYALSASGPTLYVSPNILNLYRFRINAVNGSLSGSSTSSTVSIQGPTNIVLSYVSATSTSVDLSWTSSTGANRYMVYYSTNNSVFTLFAGTSLTSVTVTGLTLATLYYFKVIPITGSSNNTGYYGNYSNTISQSTVTPNFVTTWNANGGSVTPTSTTAAYGTNISAPTPTRTNYTFLYWRDTLSAFSYIYQINPGGTWNVNADQTFYAWWQLIQYTITYNANGGTVSPTSSLVDSGTSVTLPTPTRAGYTFSGWYTATSGGSLIGTAGASYTPSATITLYAQWTIITYTITYLKNDGSGTAQGTSTFTVGGATTSASTPTRAGYTFSGWFDTGSLDYTYTVAASTSWYPPSNSFNMYARWTRITYTVTYYENGVNGNVSSVVVNALDATTLPTPTLSGYNFAGWYTAVSGGTFIGAAGASYTPTATISLYGHWTAITYTITYLKNDGSGTAQGTSTFTAGGSTVAASAPTRSGYTFNGWYDTGSLDYTYFAAAGATWYPPSNSFNMYARWSIIVVAVPSGGTVSLSGNSTAGSIITASTSGWSGSPSSYDVYITTALSPTVPTSSSTRVASSSGASSTTYTITSSDAVSPVNIFRAFATATNSGGTSGVVQSSNTITASSSSPATAPGIPGTPTNGWVGGTSYPFSWTAATAGTVIGGGAATITSYQIRIYQATSSAGAGSSLLTTYTSTGSGTSSTYTSPNAALYYAASVSATNSAGLTSASYSGISAYR